MDGYGERLLLSSVYKSTQKRQEALNNLLDKGIDRKNFKNKNEVIVLEGCDLKFTPKLNGMQTFDLIVNHIQKEIDLIVKMSRNDALANRIKFEQLEKHRFKGTLSLSPQDSRVPQINLLSNFKDGNSIKEDFFDMQLSIIVPSWPHKFRSEDFKKKLLESIHKNTAVHIKVKVIWLNLAEIIKFENAYFKYLNNKSSGNNLSLDLAKEICLFLNSKIIKQNK